MKLIKTIRKVFVRTLLGLISLLVIILLLFQVPWVQNFLARKASTMLSGQLDVSLTVDQFRLAFFNRVSLKDVALTDRNNDTIVAFSRLSAGVRVFPLLRNELYISRIRLDDPHIRLVRQQQDSLLNIVAVFRGDTTKKTKSTENQSPLSIQPGNIRIRRADFRYTDEVNRSSISVLLGNLGISPDLLDIENQEIAIDEVRIGDLVLDIRSSADSASTTGEGTGKGGPGNFPDSFTWNIGLETLVLSNNQMSIGDYDKNHNTSKKQSAFSLKGLTGNISGLRLMQGMAALEVDALSGQINRDMEIDNLAFSASFTGSALSLDALQVTSGGMSAKLDAMARYPSPGDLTAAPSKTFIELSTSATATPGTFSGYMEHSLPLKTFPSANLHLEAAGSLAEIVIDSLAVSLDQAVMMKASGKIADLTDTLGPRGQLDLHHLAVNLSLVQEYLPDTLIPAKLVVPDSLRLEGSVIAGNDSLGSELRLISPYGDLTAQATLQQFRSAGRLKYRASLASDSLHPDSLFRAGDIPGNLSFDAQISGSFVDFSDPAVSAEVLINGFDYGGYRYRNLNLSGSLIRDSMELEATMDDTHLAFTLNGEGYTGDSHAGVTLSANLMRADLAALGFSEQKSEAGGNLQASITGSGMEDLRGFVELKNAYYAQADNTWGLNRMRLNLKGDSALPVYRLNLDRLLNNDSLIARQAELIARLEKDQTIFDYHATIRNVPGAGEPFIGLSGDAVLQTDSTDFMGKGSFLLGDSAKQVRDRYTYRVDRHRVGTNASRYALQFSSKEMLVDGRVTLTEYPEGTGIDGKISMDSLNLAIIEPLVGDYLLNLEGRLSGNISASGMLENPELEGEVNFNQVRFTPSALQTPFLLEDESATLQERQMVFRELTLTDSRGNLARINGTVNLGKEAASNFDLSLVADNFLLLDKSAARGAAYYGNIIIDVEGRVDGTFDQPEIEMNTSFDQNSAFTFVVPDSKAPTGEGIIQFVDKKGNTDTAATGEREIPQDLEATSMSLEIDATAEVTDRFSLTVITNPLTGENLDISGNGNLGFQLDRSGYMGLTGKYTISEGEYELILFEVMKRVFQIEEGSYLSWSGEILEATADITAIYRVNASMEGLNQYRGAGSGTNAASARVPMEVVMNLSGPLLTPEIDFDLRTEEGYTGSEMEPVLAQLNNNESELNKQVFSLLLFNSFMPDASGGNDPVTYDFSNQSRKSVSALLSSQLDRFADRYIRDVDLDVNIQSYETERQKDVTARTDVSLDVSTDLFNERLTLEVGGSVNVEETGMSGQNLQAGSLAGDFRASYRLTPAGTYQLNIFRQTDYEGEIDGEVTSTGISINFTKDFAKFGDLFRKKKPSDEEEE